MQRTAIVLGCTLVFALLAHPQTAPSQPAKAHNEGPWWISGGMGEGQLKLSSDQQQNDRVTTFAIGFAGGRQIGKWTRVGMEVGGWSLQAFDLNDPTVGESIGNVMAIVDILPVRNRGLYGRAGVGCVTYDNNRPTATNGKGLAWEVGGGYEIPLRGGLRLAPTVEYAAGHFGDDRYATIPLTDRRYNVIEFKLAAVYHWGAGIR